MNKVIFDSSALIAIITQETGFEKLEEFLPYSAMSIISITEVISALIKKGVPEEVVRNIVDEIAPEIIPYDFATALIAGTLISDPNFAELSFENRATIASAIHLGKDLYTTDKTLNIDHLLNKAKINVI